MMLEPIRRFPWPLIGVLILLCCFRGVAQAEENVPAGLKPPAEIVQILKAWTERFSNLRMAWEVKMFHLDGRPKGEGFTSNRWQSEWAWTKTGPWRMQRIEFLDDQFIQNTVQINNQYFYSATYIGPDVPRRFPLTLKLSPAKTNQEGRFQIVPLEGQWSLFAANWLADRLEQGPIETWGYENVGDRVLPFVKIQDEPWSPVYVLDPDFGYQPRIIHTGTSFLTKVNRVEEFREIEPGFWFPWKGTERQVSPEYPDQNHFSQWEVTSAEINVEFSPNDFEIKPVLGTQVHDTFTNNYFKYGPGMPAGTMENGLNRERMARFSSGSPDSHVWPPKSPNPRLESWDRYGAKALIAVLFLGLAFLAWNYWRQIRDNPQPVPKRPE